MSTTTRKFKTVITDTGAKKLAQAAAPDGKPVRLTHMAVGDGGGTLPHQTVSRPVWCMRCGDILLIASSWTQHIRTALLRSWLFLLKRADSGSGKLVYLMSTAI